MMPKEKHSELGYPEIDSQLTRMKGPVLIVSTVVGRGMQSLGKAIEERFAKSGRSDVRHVAIEEIVSPAVVREDLKRYQWISSRFPILLNLVYRIPFFYHRKYLRERWIREADHSGIARELGSSRPATVICVSHRPCFWMSSYKWRNESGFELWGLLGEYGNNLGWRYQFWPQVDGYFSPVSRESLDTPFPETLQFENIVLPARQVYLELSASPGDPDQILLVCGYWGQGPFRKIIRELT